MKSKLYQLIPMVLITGLCACDGKLRKEEYVQWVNSYENKLHVKKEAAGFVYDLQFQPSDYVLLQRNNGQIVTSSYSQVKQRTDSMQYYTLTISLTDPKSDFIDAGLSSQEEKQEKLYYFSYQFQSDITLEDNGQTLPCVLFHFERSIDLKPARTFVLGFENPTPSAKESKLIINSYRLGNEPVEITVSKENIPSLKI